MSNYNSYYEYTSESVSEGHPDKICDQLADLILDTCLRDNPHARVACEILATSKCLVISGEIAHTSLRNEDFTPLIRNKLKDLCCTHPDFHWKDVKIQYLINNQSQELQQGIYKKDSIIGASDQGIMFGYACDETAELMPATHVYAHNIINNLTKYRRENENSRLLPDAKSQVSILYKKKDRHYIPVKITNILVSQQHQPDISQEDLNTLIAEQILLSVPAELMAADTKIYINPKGSFTVGGPVADTGLTGRKLTVDTYGGTVPHGGGSFSGKDATKMDRTGAYIARYLAKNIIAAKIAKRCTVQISYGISLANPLSLCINFHDTGIRRPLQIVNHLHNIIDLTPEGIIQEFNLLKSIYTPTAIGGHFGRRHDDPDFFSWEKLTLVPKLQIL